MSTKMQNENSWIWKKLVVVVQIVVQSIQLEVIVTGEQHTVTFNNELVLMEGSTQK